MAKKIKLFELQQSFVSAVADADVTALLPVFASFEHDEATERFNVYRDGIIGNRIKALEAVYPILRSLMGDDCFRQLAQHYALEHAPAHYTYNTYGQSLPVFLSDITAFKCYPYFHDVGAFEWLAHDLEHQSAPVAMTQTDLLQLEAAEPAKTRLTLLDGLTIFKTHYPVYAIWMQYKAEKEEEIQLTNTVEHLVLWRVGGEVHIHRLEDKQYQFLKDIQAQKNLACLNEACDLISCFQEALQFKWIKGVVTL